MLTYNGENSGLQTLINDYNHCAALIRSERVRDTLKCKTINVVESRLLSIMRTAKSVDEVWFVSARHEFIQEMRDLDRIRQTIFTFDAQAGIRSEDIGRDWQAAQKDLNIPVISTQTRCRHTLVYGAASGAAVGTAGLFATGASAFSFFAGPVIGGIVTGAVGATAGGVTAAATLVGGTVGAVKSASLNI